MTNLLEQHQSIITEITNYFEEHPNPKETQKRLHHALMIVLSSEETEGWSSNERSNLVFLFTKTTDLVENLHDIIADSKAVSL